MQARIDAFWRGFLIVCLTAANVAQISQHHYVGAFACGSAISWVWYRNARGAALESLPWLRECYAAGAGCGTVAGMLIVRAVYG